MDRTKVYMDRTKVYVVQYGDYDGSYFASVWSSEELAKSETDRLNSTFHSGVDGVYYWNEEVVDMSHSLKTFPLTPDPASATLAAHTFQPTTKEKKV